MRLLFYGNPGDPDNAGIRALAQGVKALGHRVIWRNHMFFRPGEYEDADMFAVMGLQGPISQFPAEAKARGKRVLVCDMSMLKRGQTHYVGLERTNWVPPYDCDETRLSDLGIILAPPATDGTYILVAEQMPNDASHRLDRRGLDAWLERTVCELQAAGKQYRVRPHPRIAKSATTLEEDLAGASAVITLTSNVGHDALLRGIPVFCRKDAPYAAVANVYDERTPRPFDRPGYFPGPARRKQYFARLAHGEWTTGELESGEAFEFLRAMIGKEADGDAPDALPLDATDEDGEGAGEAEEGEIDPAAAPAVIVKRKGGRPPKIRPPVVTDAPSMEQLIT